MTPKGAAHQAGYAQVKGPKLHCVIHGSGQLPILLHGGSTGIVTPGMIREGSSISSRGFPVKVMENR